MTHRFHAEDAEFLQEETLLVIVLIQILSPGDLSSRGELLSILL